jgi:hypothetical protein
VLWFVRATIGSVYQSDYILRMIAQMGGLLRRAIAELRTDPAEALRLAEEAVRASSDAGLPLIDALSSEGLVAYVSAGGDVDAARAVVLARALNARADALAAGGNVARAAEQRAKADALLAAARSAHPDLTESVERELDAEVALDG